MKKNKEYFLYFFLFFLLFFSIFLIFFPKNYQELEKSISFFSNIYTIVNPNSEISKIENTKENFQGKIKNFLFLGIAGEGSRGSYLTDTILIISLNEIKEKIFLISLPRDLLVQVPDKNFSTKINTLFELENQRKKSHQNKTFEYIKTKVNQITGLEISEVIVLDLEAVKSIIDQLGGIDIYLEKPVYDPNLVNPQNPSQIFYLEPGWRHLNGDMFLKLIRTRYAPEGDFYRMKNQQMLLMALKNKIEQLINNWSIISWLQILQSLSGHYFTTLSPSDFLDLISLFKKIHHYPIENIIIDTQNSGLLTSTGYYDGLGKYVYALIPKAGFENYSEIQNFINQKIYE